jgi:hypothetical protein
LQEIEVLRITFLALADLKNMYYFKYEIKYYILVLGLVAVMGLFLKALDNPTHIEHGSWATVVHATEVSPTPAITYKDKYQKAIYEVFGEEDGRVMYAIAQAESGLREDAYNTYNSNGTIDLGLLQINSVHFHKEGCDPKKLMEYKGNIDCGYKIFKSSGFGAWSAYNSGAYLEKL